MENPTQNQSPTPEGAAGGPVDPEAEAPNRQTGQEANPQQEWADRPAVRLGANLLMVGFVLAVVFLVGQRILTSQQAPVSQAAFEIPSESTNQHVDLTNLSLPPLDSGETYLLAGIPRKLELETHIPPRPRSDVITYTVKQGDTLFGIAEKFGLKPETMLWSNYETLKDNPELLSPDQDLFILPVDGAYHKWQDGDTMASVASFFEVEPDAILAYSGNELDLAETEDGAYGLHPGDWLIIPGGKRPFKDWGPPAILRSNPASARTYGPGYCGEIYAGAIGNGTFVWPTVEHFLSGYHYSSIHHGIDIGGAMGNAIFASDGGVVVYAGWSNYGYGNLIVVDHGTGWQTVYAHLSSLAVSCGTSVGQGTYIGAMGSTGNSSGPHLHFEMIYNGSKVNPMDFVQ